MSAPLSVARPDFELPYTSYAPDGQNGRINFSAPRAGGAGSGSIEATGDLTVPGFEYGTAAEPNFVEDMLRGNMTPSKVALAFFTPRNVRILQSEIRYQVYIRSGPKKYQIDDQDVDELKMIMRGIYYQYAKNNIYDVEGQVLELNKLIVDWAAPRILSEVDQYQYYLKDISHLPVPIMQPMNMSSAGQRSLPFQPFT
jgi:hypothetical protein